MLFLLLDYYCDTLGEIWCPPLLFTLLWTTDWGANWAYFTGGVFILRGGGGGIGLNMALGGGWEELNFWYPFLNPLLQNSLQFFHPPLFFFLTFMFFLARGIYEYLYTLPGGLRGIWIFLFLGMWWAYQEDTWGGWWNNDLSEFLSLWFLWPWFLHFHYRQIRTLLLDPPLFLIFSLSFFYVQYLFTQSIHNFGLRFFTPPITLTTSYELMIGGMFLFLFFLYSTRWVCRTPPYIWDDSYRILLPLVGGVLVFIDSTLLQIPLLYSLSLIFPLLTSPARSVFTLQSSPLPISIHYWAHNLWALTLLLTWIENSTYVAHTTIELTSLFHYLLLSPPPSYTTTYLPFLGMGILTNLV